MRRVTRKFRRHFGAAAKQVSVRSQRAWYWQLLTAAVFVLLGYLLAYWHLTQGHVLEAHLFKQSEATTMAGINNQQLAARAVQSERQLQVAQAAQNNLAQQLANMQDEAIRLKEDLAFYQNIINETPGANELKLNSFKVNKGKLPNQYEYHIVLVQSGSHDKLVQGTLKLSLNASRGDVPLQLPLQEATGGTAPVKVNFKYYQRIDGNFMLPQDAQVHSLQADFIELNAKAGKPRLSQQADVPA